MAGATTYRKLTSARTGGVSFALASQEDDADIRRLLRQNPMAGQISITLEREPDYFAEARLPGAVKQTIVARENGRLVCTGSCVIRENFINGRSRPVGYLGGLRLDARAAGRFDILRQGYEFFRAIQANKPAAFYYTSIAADNAQARRFLERGLPGMPVYEFLGEFVTLLLSVKQRFPIFPAKGNGNFEIKELAGFIKKQAVNFQFAQYWSATDLPSLQSLNLNTGDFCVVRDGRALVAIAALWDQRAFKQTVIKNYSRGLNWTRPMLNFAAPLIGIPRLPLVGSTVPHAFVSHLAVASEKLDSLVELTGRLAALASGRGIELLTLGFAAHDPRVAILRNKFRFREYRSRIYVVRWPGLGGSVQELDGRCLGPEVALL